jgi:hypothetical protein
MDEIDQVALEFYLDDEIFDTAAIIAADDLMSEDGRKRGSRAGGIPNRLRDFASADRTMAAHYFSPTPLYDAAAFRRRYRMPIELFNKLLTEIPQANSYFSQKADCTGKIGASERQKLFAAIKMLADGISADSKDEYCQLAESTVLVCMRHFCQTIAMLYEKQYLRQPSSRNAGVPGLHALGMEELSKAWAGQFCGKEKKPTVILEAVATQDLWIWHAFFGLPGTLNDINVLDRSPLFSGLMAGRAPQCQWSLPGSDNTMGYYLAD